MRERSSTVGVDAWISAVPSGCRRVSRAREHLVVKFIDRAQALGPRAARKGWGLRKWLPTRQSIRGNARRGLPGRMTRRSCPRSIPCGSSLVGRLKLNAVAKALVRIPSAVARGQYSPPDQTGIEGAAAQQECCEPAPERYTRPSTPVFPVEMLSILQTASLSPLLEDVTGVPPRGTSANFNRSAFPRERHLWPALYLDYSLT